MSEARLALFVQLDGNEGEDPIDREENTQPLSSLYRDEVAAVETYDAALHHAQMHPWATALGTQRAAHADRVMAIAKRLIAVHSPVPASSGAWGTWVRLATEAAASFAPEMALSVILEEEESLVKDYQLLAPIVDSESRTLVNDRLLPSQLETFDAVRTLHSEAGR